MPSSCSGARIATAMNCIAISSPVLSTSRKMSHSSVNSTDSLSRLSVEPCQNVSQRMCRTLAISSANTASVLASRRRISRKVRPRLLISATLRSDSVMKPALRVVSRLIERCWPRICRLSKPLRPPSTSRPIRNTGTSAQLLVTAYQTRKPMPMAEANSTLMKALRKRSVSARTRISSDRVSPLRRSSNSWISRRMVWRRPSLKICVPKRCTTSRVMYSCTALVARDTRATTTARPSRSSAPRTSSSSLLTWRCVA
ncbi:hypothetical protein Y695_03284 [Hydrogenophaga sp. T4]|nr:hypothetical protein Y695_03284 [Hydrogenophaga sp. T4]